MEYPTIAQVEAADYDQLVSWSQSLPSPGASATEEQRGTDQYIAIEDHEMTILRHICARLTPSTPRPQ